MSGIAGIFHRNGEVVDSDIATNFLDALSYWKPDKNGIIQKDHIALFHTMLWNTPESQFEQLPRSHTHLSITMDARLDNRDELAKELNLSNDLHTFDSDFILAAYLKWQENCPKYLLGDFAFAIWDNNKQQLFCARDHVGVKQFYFHLTKNRFILGNDIKGLSQHPDISAKISDKAVANFIVNSQLIHPSLTFYKDIQQLPPAHSLTITSTQTHKVCYWKLEDAPVVKLPNAKAYAKELSKLLEQAVYDRMRTAYSITSHLSGGLDSSSIAVIAARKLRDNGKKLLAFNWVPEPTADDDPEHYEWSNSKTVADSEGIDHHYVSLNSENIIHYMRDRNIAYGESATFWYEYPVREAAQSSGARTILSGWGGDELVTYHGQSYYCDLLLQGKLKTLLREIHCQVRRKKSTNYFRKILSIFYHNIFMVLVPRAFYCYLPKNRSLEKPLFPFVNKKFKSTIQHEAQTPRGLTMQPQRTIRKHMLAFWRNGHLQSRIESWATSAITKRLEYCYPLLDKRIVEFAVGIPTELWIKNGTNRYIFRSAVSKTLPEEIVWGNSKLESNRVKKLISLYFSSCLLFTEQKNLKDKESKYIDFTAVNQKLREMKSYHDDQEMSQTIIDIKTSIATWNLHVKNKTHDEC